MTRDFEPSAIVRPARASDADVVCAIVRDAYNRWIPRFGRRPSPMRDDYLRRIKDEQVWVIEQAGAIVGLAMLKDGPDALRVPNIAVSPAAQGQGFGRQLLAFAAAEAKRRGYCSLQLAVNALMVENIALYQHLGFHEIKRIESESPDRVYVVMARPVT